MPEHFVYLFQHIRSGKEVIWNIIRANIFFTFQIINVLEIFRKTFRSCFQKILSYHREVFLKLRIFYDRNKLFDIIIDRLSHCFQDIDSAVSSAHTLEEFQKILSEKYGILIKESRGRFSYLHPERTKPITGRNLGTHYEKNYLLQAIENNVKCHDKEVVTPVPKAAMPAPEMYAAQNSSIPHETAFAILFIKSDLHLVTDLQNCVKAQQNAAYARKVKLSNLKEMAKTVAYVQEHGYDSLDALETSFSSVKEHTDTFRKNLKSTERDLREINEQLHYTGQYLANKAIYTKFCQSKNKGVFRKEHSAEIALYETARKFLKEKSGNIKLPSMKLLKEKKEELLKQKKSAQEQYQYYRDYQKELNTVRSNINSILGKEYPHQKTHTKEQTLT